MVDLLGHLTGRAQLPSHGGLREQEVEPLPRPHGRAYVLVLGVRDLGQAQQVSHEIEERPLVSAMTAFGAGVAIGMLFSGRH